jgi:hypothetical protein
MWKFKTRFFQVTSFLILNIIHNKLSIYFLWSKTWSKMFFNYVHECRVRHNIGVGYPVRYEIKKFNIIVN